MASPLGSVRRPYGQLCFSLGVLLSRGTGDASNIEELCSELSQKHTAEHLKPDLRLTSLRERIRKRACMMLIVEVLAHGRWNEVGRCFAGHERGTMSDTRDGVRHIVLFEYGADHSSIYRLGPGADLEAGSLRLVPESMEGAEVLATLRSGESTILTVNTDKSGGAARTIRFRHE